MAAGFSIPQVGNFVLEIALILLVYSIAANVCGARRNPLDFVVCRRRATRRVAAAAVGAFCAIIVGCRSPGASQIPSGLFASHEASERGRTLFVEHCAICHGQAGDGHGARGVGMDPSPADLTVPPWSDSASAGQTYRAIHDGVQGTAMPSWLILTDQQIWDLVAYIHSLGES